MTLKHMLLLAAPHSWSASVIPALLGIALSASPAFSPDNLSRFGLFVFHPINVFCAIILIVISVLFQSAVNIINDYYDFKKGTDTKDNQPDPLDAVLVYNNLNPAHVLILAVGCIVAAFILGLYVIFEGGFAPLFIALFGVAIIFLYSGGSMPISYLPLGELVSGFTMGGLIPLACYIALNHNLSIWPIFASLPVVIGIGLIMATNNTCDIEKDVAAGRKTFAVIKGRDAARRAYHAAVYLWLISIAILELFIYAPGIIFSLAMIPFYIMDVKKLLANPLLPTTRREAFQLVTGLNVKLGLAYCASIALAISGIGI